MTSRFAAPTTLADALAILATDRDARPVAGGTDLVVAARQGRTALPESIVAIDRIDELGRHEIVDGSLVLGALASHDWLAESPDVRAGWTALADASAIVGATAVRATRAAAIRPSWLNVMSAAAPTTAISIARRNSRRM